VLRSASSEENQQRVKGRVAVSCSVSQCVAVCRRVLQCVAVRRSVLVVKRTRKEPRSMLMEFESGVLVEENVARFAVYYSVLQSVAVC